MSVFIFYRWVGLGFLASLRINNVWLDITKKTSSFANLTETGAGFDRETGPEWAKLFFMLEIRCRGVTLSCSSSTFSFFRSILEPVLTFRGLLVARLFSVSIKYHPVKTYNSLTEGMIQYFENVTC